MINNSIKLKIEFVQLCHYNAQSPKAVEGVPVAAPGQDQYYKLLTRAKSLRSLRRIEARATVMPLVVMPLGQPTAGHCWLPLFWNVQFRPNEHKNHVMVYSEEILISILLLLNTH